MTVRIPKYRRHKPTGQALVEIRGRRIYLGKYGASQSREKYHRLVAEFAFGGDVYQSWFQTSADLSSRG